MCGVIPINGCGCTGGGRRGQRESLPSILRDDSRPSVKTIMKTLSELAALLGLELAQGDGAGVLRGVAGIPAAGCEDLVFAEDEQALAQAQGSNAGAVLTTAALAAQVKGTKPMLIAKQPRLEFARAARALRVESVGS